MKETNIKNYNKNIIFKESFEDAAAILKNGGISTNVTILNGVASFLASSPSYIVYQQNSIFNNNTISIRGRFKYSLNDDTNKCIFSNGNNVAASGRGIYIGTTRSGLGSSGNKLTVFVGDGTNYASAITDSVINDGKFHEFLLVINNTVTKTMWLYLDGVLQGTARSLSTVTGSIYLTVSTFRLGSDVVGSTAFTGDLDLFEIYETTLTSQDAINLYSNRFYRNDLTRSYSESLGSDFVPNGNFSSDTIWSKGTNVTITGGQLVCVNSAAGTGSNTVQILSTLVIPNAYYKVTIKIDEVSGGNIVVRNSSGSGGVFISGANTPGIYTGYGSFLVDTNFVISPDTAGMNFKIDYVTMQRVTGDLSLLMYFDATTGTLKDYSKLRTFTTNNVSIVKDGNIWCGEFDGDTSYISCGSDFMGTNNITINAWVKPFSYGEGDAGMIIRNNKLDLYLRGSIYNAIRVSSDGSGTNAAASFTEMGKWSMISFTRTTTGVANIYLNGVLVGTADQSSGIPAAGSTVYIGNSAGSSQGFKGRIARLSVYKGLMTQERIRQMFTSQKSLFNL